MQQMIAYRNSAISSMLTGISIAGGGPDVREGIFYLSSGSDEGAREDRIL